MVVYNINWDHNSELLEACQMLKEYAQFVNQVRTYAKELPIPEAVEKAVDYCINNGILADFLSKNRMEAIEMCIFEFDEEKFIKSEREWAREKGQKEILINVIENAMKNLNTDLKGACEILGRTVEEYESAKEMITS